MRKKVITMVMTYSMVLHTYKDTHTKINGQIDDSTEIKLRGVWRRLDGGCEFYHSALLGKLAPPSLCYKHIPIESSIWPLILVCVSHTSG